jgi:nucleotide-binding universal stress UspA family protein
MPEIEGAGGVQTHLATIDVTTEVRMYTNILVPTDCSGFDREAIRVALRVAEQGAAQVHLVRVLTTATFFGMAASPDGGALSGEVMAEEHDAALAELYALAAECRTYGEYNVKVSLERGPVPDALEAYAKRNDVDLIVISSHGRSGISRLSLGSVTDSLIRHTTIPVLVVKLPSSYLNPQVREAFKKIVVPLDGSELAEQVLWQVITLAGLDDAEIKLLYVLKPELVDGNYSAERILPWWEKDVAAAQSYLFGTAEILRRKGFAVTTDVVIGESVAEQITDYAGREGCDLIAIATHGRGGLSRMLRGSVGDAVTRSARTCILVFHPSKTTAEHFVENGGLGRASKTMVPA